MKDKELLLLGFGLLAVLQTPLGAVEPQPAGVRTIRLLQDDAQLNLATKVYELKYVKATDIRPYVNAAVKRYHAKSQVERVNYAVAQKNYLIVTTGEKFFPYVDEMIEKIDRPGVRDQYGSLLEGTGITRVAYTPNYRASEDIVRIINLAIKSVEGGAYLNKPTNTIYFKDDKLAAALDLAWIQNLDRPVPQVNLRLNYYEIRESTLRDIGVDYLAWKNGPGLNLFETAYNGGKIISNETLLNLVNNSSQWAETASSFASSWGYGGFFTAPQFDLSFIRLLQQSGDARLAASTNLTFVNTAIYDDPALNTHLPRKYSATLIPDYQNLKKNADDRTDVVNSSVSSFEFIVTNPVICFGPESGDISPVGHIPSSQEFYRKNNGGVVFSYQILSRQVVERNNRGDELGNSGLVSGSLTLGFKTEKLLSLYTKETNTEQTIGIPFLIKVPVLKYLVGTTTSIKEKTYIVVTAEANLVHPELLPPAPVSRDVILEEQN